MENLMTTNPFSFKTSFIGDIEIGGGQIKSFLFAYIINILFVFAK